MEPLIQEQPGVYRATGLMTDQDILNAAYKIAVSYFVPGREIDCPATAAAALFHVLKDTEYEIFGCLMLDSGHRVIKNVEIAKGTIDSAVVHPRRVVQEALMANAATVLFYHNHPSGITTPSESDKALTCRLKDALRLVEIRTMDHIIVAKGGYSSFAQLGLF